MWILSHLLCVVTSVFEGTVSLVNAIFHLNYVLGSLITQAVVGVYEHVAEIFLSLYTGASYAFCDLLHFVFELYSLISSTSDIVELLFRAVVDSMCYIYYGLQHTALFVWGHACDVIHTVADGAAATIFLASYLLGLLLRSGLLLLELPPRLLRQAGEWTYNGICTICQHVASTITSISNLTVAGVLNTVRDIWRTLFFQPGDVYIGLCMLVAFGIFIKLWPRWGTGRMTWKLRIRRRKDLCEEKQHRERPVEACVVCQDAPRNVLLLPCRHFSLCEDCTRILLEEGHDCPMCRHPIYEAIPVFS